MKTQMFSNFGNLNVAIAFSLNRKDHEVESNNSNEPIKVPSIWYRKKYQKQKL